MCALHLEAKQKLSPTACMLSACLESIAELTPMALEAIMAIRNEITVVLYIFVRCYEPVAGGGIHLLASPCLSLSLSVRSLFVSNKSRTAEHVFMVFDIWEF